MRVRVSTTRYSPRLGLALGLGLGVGLNQPYQTLTPPNLKDRHALDNDDLGLHLAAALAPLVQDEP